MAAVLHCWRHSLRHSLATSLGFTLRSLRMQRIRKYKPRDLRISKRMRSYIAPDSRHDKFLDGIVANFHYDEWTPWDRYLFLRQRFRERGGLLVNKTDDQTTHIIGSSWKQVLGKEIHCDRCPERLAASKIVVSWDWIEACIIFDMRVDEKMFNLAEDGEVEGQLARFKAKYGKQKADGDWEYLPIEESPEVVQGIPPKSPPKPQFDGLVSPPIHWCPDSQSP